MTVPFVCGCGECPECQAGNQQVCDHQSQPGFTHWGSFAEFVALATPTSTWSRCPNAWRSTRGESRLPLRDLLSRRRRPGQASAGQWVAVHGCGGVGLSAVMIASAVGANVVGVDIADEKLALARELGAVATVNANAVADVAEAVIEATRRRRARVDRRAWGADDRLQFGELPAKRGKHIQVGLLLAEHSAPRIPMAGWSARSSKCSAATACRRTATGR